MEFSKDNTSGGAFYIQKPDGTKEFLCMGDIPNIEFTEITDEIMPTPYRLNDSAEISCNVSYVDLEMLNNLCAATMPTDNFVLKHNVPIMIQARWHKKARIRKKWLKRFGMKPDVINCVVDAYVASYDADDCLTVGINDMKFIPRPDQKRRDLMFEW